MKTASPPRNPNSNDEFADVESLNLSLERVPAVQLTPHDNIIYGMLIT